MSDQRFARLRADPRFRRPKNRTAKLAVDDRFKSIFSHKHPKKASAASVDKYGRSLSDTRDQDNLRQFYRLESNTELLGLDYARGEVMLESSEDSDGSADEGPVDIGKRPAKLPPNLLDSTDDIDLDENTIALLDSQVAAYNEANKETENTGLRTHRLAVVNLDWDHVRAAHLYQIFSSVLPHPVATTTNLPPGGSSNPSKSPHRVVHGKVCSVRVYPSEFGKERMAREEKEGPPVDIFRKPTQADGGDITRENLYDLAEANADYDEDALRRYQLERLRYYYAIVTCNSVETAEHLYTELDGTELERSANVFNLSYVPDDMSFDEPYREEATSTVNVPSKPVDFVTDALRHSKVKLTWDEDDPERMHLTRRALTQKEIEDADFHAYIASSSSEDEAKGKGKDSRDKLRHLLLGKADDLPEGWTEEEKEDVDMEITFTPALAKSRPSDETTLEKYRRKVREKRKERKNQQKQQGLEPPNDVSDEFFEIDDAGNDRSPPQSLKKEERPFKHAKGVVSIEEDSDEDQNHHFDMKAILRAEKSVKRGKRHHRLRQKGLETQEDFAINVQDSRFSVLHEDHRFAIDPTNPHFKKTKSMAALLEQRTKHSKIASGKTEEDTTDAYQGFEHGLTSLVDRVKRKSQVARYANPTKRRKQ